MIKRVLTIYYYKVWNQKDFRLLPFLFSDSCKVNYFGRSSQRSVIINPETVVEHIEKCLQLFPDLQFEIVHLICNNEYASAHCALKYTSGNETLQFEFLNMFKISGGKISEQWLYADVLDILIESISATHTVASL